MFYTRGSSDEFDRLARISGDEGWSWEAMLPYILKASLIVMIFRDPTLTAAGVCRAKP